jgi:hypothetical protein
VWWCIPVILDAWEAEIGMILAQGHSRQKARETPSQQLGSGHAYDPSYVGGIGRRSQSEADLVQKHKTKLHPFT